jgi:uncharacterized membrane protein
MKRFTLSFVLLLIGALNATARISFVPTGVLDMLPISMSDDGTIVVGIGIFGSPNLYYTESTGAVIIGDGCSNGLPAISGDGSTVLGCHVDADGNENAAKWLGGMDWLDLGSEAGAVPCGTSLSGAYGVNGDGSIGVGLLWRAQVCKANAGTWDLVNGGPAEVLPSVIDGPATRANAVNGDGTVIVGWQDQLTGERTAAKWVNRVPELILTDSGDLNGEAHAVSVDGRTIVGDGYQQGNLAWIWRDGIGVRSIGIGNHGHDRGRFVALDVTDDGKVAIGSVEKGFNLRGFIWREGKGAAFLDSLLAQRGVIIPPGWTLDALLVISANGKVIYGWGFNPDSRIEMFRVELSGSEHW